MKATLSALTAWAERVLNGPDDRPGALLELPTLNDRRMPYYKYLFHVARRLSPAFVVEIGSWKGTSTAHLAHGCAPAGWVLTIDADWGCVKAVRELDLKNVVSLHEWSKEAPALLRRLPPVDLLFVDGAHGAQVTLDDYRAYRPFVRPGGVILFDDIGGDGGIRAAWEQVEDPKVEIPALHPGSGFGVAVKK